MGVSRFHKKRFKAVPLVLVIVLLLTNLTISVSADPLDSDFDGWTDEYELIIGTDPNNPDTDGDGIRDSDDPTPKGSFMNIEEAWEAFEFTISANRIVATVGYEIVLDVNVLKIDPWGGRIVWDDKPIWLLVYVQPYYGNLRQEELLEENAVHGNATFTYTPTEPGYHYFVAIANRTGIPLGEQARLNEITKLKGEKRCEYKRVTIYPDYYATIRAEYTHISPSYANTYYLELWTFDPQDTSEEYLAKYANSYNPKYLQDLSELYVMTSGDVYIYFNRNGGQHFETVYVEEEGTTWNYTLTFPAIYSISVTKYEQQFSWDAALSHKYPYATITVYNHPDYITSISVLYPDLLPGHTDIFHINVLQFSGPSNSHNNLYHNATGTVDIHVAEYYYTSYGIHYINIHDATLGIGINGSDWSFTFTYAADFVVAATYYTDSFSWYSNPFNKPYSKAFLTIHDNLISWVNYPPGNMDVFSSEEITVNRVYLVNINESTFHELYHSIGMVGIAEDYPEYTSPWSGTACVDVYYLVDNWDPQYIPSNSKYFYRKPYHYIYEWAYKIHRVSISISGSKTLIYDFNIPGKYAIAVSYSYQLFTPSHKFDSRMLYEKCSFLSISRVHTDYVVNTFSAKDCYFVGEDVELSVTNVNNSGVVESLQMLLFINSPYRYEIEDISELGYAIFLLNGLSAGTHDFYGMPYYDPLMIDIIQELGLEDFQYSRNRYQTKYWISRVTVYLRNLAIYSNHPSQFVKGLPASFRVVVYDKEMRPSEKCWVTVELLYRKYENGHWSYHKVMVFHDKTDASGTAYVDFVFPDKSHDFYAMKISAKKNGLEDSIQSSISARDQRIEGIITTDKPMYHSGDTIYVKFLVWNMDTLKPFTGTIDVILTDPYDRDIFKVGVTPDEYGNGGLDIPLADEMPWGTYSVRLERQGNGHKITSKNIDIKHYELPTVYAYFETDLEYVEIGDEVRLALRIEYMFGAPVTEGNVSYIITGITHDTYTYSSPWYVMPITFDFTPIVFDGPIIGTETNGTSEPVTQPQNYPITGQLVVENGWAYITFTVPEKDVDEIKIEANFWDRFGHEAQASHSLQVGKPIENEVDVKLSIWSDHSGYIPDDEIPIHIRLEEVHSGEEEYTEPIPDAKINLTITVLNINYSSEIILQMNITTDENGLFNTTLQKLGVPILGLLEKMSYYYEIDAKYNDNEGTYKENSTEFKIYRLGHIVNTNKANYTADEECEITLGVNDYALDKHIINNFSLRIYRVATTDIFTLDGQLDDDLMLIVWNIPQTIPSGRYIIEVQYNESTVFHQIQVVDEVPNKLQLTSSQAQYKSKDKIELTAELEKTHCGWIYFDIIAGDEFITKQFEIHGSSATTSFVCEEWRYPITAWAYIIDAHGRLISCSVQIALDMPRLRIEIVTDNNTYEPGSVATVTVKVIDEYGNIVPYPLIALSVVDAAVFEVEEDGDETIWLDDFRTPYTKNRGYFMQTNWLAEVWYPADIGFESLVFWPDHKPIPYLRIGGPWSYNFCCDCDYVTFSAGAPLAEMPHTAELSTELQTELENTKIRKWFTETALWDAGVKAGENGTYTWDVLLPDNIAKWRLKAIASTKDCRGGVGYTYINTSKDFFIEPLIPYVFYQDDEITFKVRVYNFNNISLGVTLGLTAGPWLLVFGPNEKEFTINAMEVREVEFFVTILEHGRQNLTLIATDFGDNVDAVIDAFNIRPNGALKTTHLTGDVEHKATEMAEYFEEKIDGSEEAVLRLAVGYQGLLLDGFRSLGDYPYGCTEQTMSKLLPNVLMWEYYDAIGELKESTRIWLSRLILRQIQRLYYYQHNDGGWGWWKADETDVWMTAYVLFGLGKAKEAGFYICPSTITRAQQCLLAMMDPVDYFWHGSGWLEGKDAILSAYVVNAFACSEYKGSLTWQLKYLDDAWDHGELKDPYGATFYVMTLLELQKKARAKITIDWLMNHKTGPHWEAGASLGGVDETTGWIAYALTREGDHKADVRGALEWLAMLRLPGGGWGTTSDTIAAMFAIVEVVKTMEEIDMTVEVFVNGEKIRKIHVDESSYKSMRDFKSGTDAIDLEPYMNDGENKIEIKKTGKGDLFYEITVIQYLRTEVMVNYQEEVEASINELFNIDIEVDPVNSDIVDVVNLKLEISDVDGLALLSSDMSEPKENDGVYLFTNTYYAEQSGTYDILPIIVQYQLDAGERDSGIIKRYYGPITVNVSDENSLMYEQGRGTRSGDDDLKNTLTKFVSKRVIRIGDFVNVVLDLKIDSVLADKNLQIMDFVPSAFIVVDSCEGELTDNRITWEVTSKEGVKISYTLRAMKDYNGELGKAVALYGNRVIATSQPTKLTSTSNQFYVIRELSAKVTDVFEPVTVTLIVRSVDEPVWYVALEDYFGAGCKVDKGSIKVCNETTKVPIEDSFNVQSYKVEGDKIVFFIRNAENVTIEYNIIPTLVSRVVIPSAKVYSMYNESMVAESGADLLKVGDVDSLIASAQGSTTSLSGPDGPGDGGQPSCDSEDKKDSRQENKVTMLIIGSLMVLLATTMTAIKLHRRKSGQKKTLSKEESRKDSGKLRNNLPPAVILLLVAMLVVAPEIALYSLSGGS